MVVTAYPINQRSAHCFLCGQIYFGGESHICSNVHVAAVEEKREALTDDDGKEPLAWLPWAAIEALSEVQAYGHAKYKDFNNYRKGMRVSRNLSCALRHISQYMQGADLDAESGKPHLAHAMARIAFVLQNLAEGKAIDDRYKQEKV